MCDGGGGAVLKPLPLQALERNARTTHSGCCVHCSCLSAQTRLVPTEPSSFLQIQYLHSSCRLTVDQYSHIDTLLTSCGDEWGEGGAVLRPGHVKTGRQSYNGRIEN